MSILVPIDATSWLQQDPGQATPDVMPAVAGHFTLFCWLNNLAPEVVLPAYKAALVLFTTADLANPSYSDPYALVKIVQSAGVQGITLEVSTLTMPVVTTGVEKRAVAITYDHTTHVWTFYLRRTAAWEVVGTITSSFATSDITQMRGLNDGIASGSIGSLSMAYFRLWNGKKLTLDELEDEANSAVAITAAVTTDTPLVTTTDLTDVSGNDHPWYVTGAGLTTALPGPLAAPPSFLIMPDGAAATGSNPSYLCAAVASTVGSPLSTVAVLQIIPIPAHPVVAACFKAAGGWWQACDDAGTGHSELLEYSASGVLLRTIPLGFHIGNGANGRHDLMELTAGSVVTAPAGSLAFVRDSGLVRFETPAGVVIGDITVAVGPHLFSSNGNLVQLPSGDVALIMGAGSGTPTIYFLTGQFTANLSAVLVPPTGGYASGANGTSVFGALNGTGARVYAANGVVTANVIIPGSPDTLAMNLDGTVLYTVDDSTLPATHLVSQTTGGVTSTFLDRSGPGDVTQNANPGGVLVLQDGTVITNWLDASNNAFMLAHTPAGAQLWRWDYGLTPNVDLTVSAARGATAAYFWAGFYRGATVDFTQVRASDHAVLSSFTKPSAGDGVIRYDSTPVLEITQDVSFGVPGDLLTVNRSSHAVIRLSSVDGSVVHTYGLVANPFDGAVNTDGTRLVYINGLNIQAWDLENDLDLGQMFATDVATRCLVWLQDCSLAMTTAVYLADGPGRRYTVGGTLLNSYAYNPTPFAEGQLVLYANTAENRVLLIGAWDNGESPEQPAAVIFNLSSGAQIGPVVPLVGQLVDYDGLTAIAQVGAAVMCNPFPPVPPAPVFIPIRREIEFALMPEGDLNRRKYISRFEVIVQAGIGLPSGQGSDPHFVVQFSDGGKVWGPLLTMAVGKQGDYGLPVFKNRIGYAYDPRARLVTSDPVDWQIVKCTIDVEEDESMP